MKLPVPYFKSVNDTECGPRALQMVLAFFGEEKSCEELAMLQKQLDSGLVWTVGIARAAKTLGYRTQVLSQSNFNPDENDIEYYKKFSDDKGMLVLKELHDECKNLGVEFIEKNMVLNELLSHASHNSLPIVLVNWNVIAGKDGFSGHFLPVTGYDYENIYVHNPGIAQAQEHLPIARQTFIKAWESKGTDKDVVVVFKEDLRNPEPNRLQTT